MSRPAAVVVSGEVAAAPQVALLPSSGMGHLIPFIRLAAELASRGCGVTFITPTPVISGAEARHVADLVASSAGIRPLEFPLLPFDSSTAASTDPFFLQFEAIRRSAALLGPLLSSAAPRLSALICDVTLTSAVLPVAAAVPLPTYVLFTSSAQMLSLCVSFPQIAGASLPAILKIPGLAEDLPLRSIPQPLRDPGNLFTTQFVENGKVMVHADGIVINTWEALEPATLAALNTGKVVPGLPPVVAIGPILPEHSQSNSAGGGGDDSLAWLDGQPTGSVVYVSFGSRTALSPEQTREMAGGLESSGCRFLWVVKTKKLDKEEQEEQEEQAMEELFGDGFLRRVEGRGRVVKGWVDQGAILAHPAVGGFVSHCGWNSVTEAALRGIRVLAWPQHGDQRMNAGVMEKSGLGEWPKEWSWQGEGVLVQGEEIGRRLRGLMASAAVAAAAAKVKEETVRSKIAGGSSYSGLANLIARFADSRPT
ncbi:unnamed protein product [Spirodela intermedia]|uniref:Glycosyltransferase n=1 Tax=Spirodela intermedia TaxID=51605 RepID=A0A7I8LIF2_SPIIN|nr:unnamed protein product [Spirodela intermedia]